MNSALDATHLAQPGCPLSDSILTFTGRLVNPLDPDPATIVIEDIAHALANQCRWSGHTRRFYSVAEHSIHISDAIFGRAQLEALMHDAPEAYLVDLPTPLKHHPSFGRMYRGAEAQLWAVIAKKFDLDAEMPVIVPIVDAALLEAERQVLMGGQPEYVAAGLARRVTLGIPHDAEDQFLRRFFKLSLERRFAQEWPARNYEGAQA